jgi:hypothetical protein
MENWLHDAIAESIKSIHKNIDNGEDFPPWPEILPKGTHGHLRSRHGLRERLKVYDAVARKLDHSSRASLLEALEQTNRIADLVSGTGDCTTTDGLPESARAAIKSLFHFAFELLTDLGVRDRSYRIVYQAIQRVCPFCGVEPFEKPGAPREDLDHYLNKDLYAFASANLRNLVPMGTKCNSKYKLSANILRRADGTRRTAFDPYNHAGLAAMPLN